ncbi:MAG: serine hydrolase domain-containing protein [Azospirillaceae bacterium]
MPVTRRTVIAGAAALIALPRLAFAQSGPLEAAAAYSADRRGVSFLVLDHGQPIHEHYPNGGGPDRAWELASGTKSFSGIIAAAAVRDGLLALDEPCAATLPEWRDGRAAITLRQLLTLTGGIESGIGRPPGYAAAVGAMPTAAPGSRFDYGPVPFQIFGEIMRRKLRATGREGDPVAWLNDRVLTPLGIAASDWRHGRDGNPMLPQGAQFTARALAAFGQYVLSGSPGLDPSALAACFTGSAANPGYGLTWWLLRPGLLGPTDSDRQDFAALGRAFADEDIVMAAGAGDQRLYLVRRRGLVVVRQARGILRAMLGGSDWSDAEFLSLLLRA